MLPDSETISTLLKDFLQKSLIEEPENRPTAEMLLQHRFLQKADPLLFLTTYTPSEVN